MAQKEHSNLLGSLLTLNFDILKIKQGDRNPVQDLDKAIIELNTLAAKAGNPNVTIRWVVAKDSVGPCLKATINFKRPTDCVQFAQFVHELQESADHHSNFAMDNFQTITIMLSTHHPIPAITSVDVLFAHAVTHKAL